MPSMRQLSLTRVTLKPDTWSKIKTDYPTPATDFHGQAVIKCKLSVLYSGSPLNNGLGGVELCVFAQLRDDFCLSSKETVEWQPREIEEVISL
ncbi:hypothetical protein BaRGS_00006019 [Batillaria attramentaria]|uniref:Uncharacterized protein n=1 Tax=Batillaria attramentaria TaxID=370345 RepID=A0ABD0LT80_9CAEN